MARIVRHKKQLHAEKNSVYIMRINGMTICEVKHEQPIVYDKQHVAADSDGQARAVQVSDAAWNKVVMEVMEEYDAAWTQLADA
jgi:hypothetical protein